MIHGNQLFQIALIAHALTFFVVMLVVWVLVKGSVLVLMFYLYRP